MKGYEKIMERSFIAHEESKYVKNWNEYIELAKKQNTFIKKFFEENNIEAKEYRMGGDGLINCVFNEDNKSKNYFEDCPY